MNVVPNSTKAEVPLSKGATVCVAAFQRAAGGATPAPQSDIWKASNTYAVQADGSLAASLTDDGGNPAAGSAPDMELHSGTYDFYAYSPALKTEADKYTVKGIPHYTDFMGALLPGRAVSRSTARVDLKFEHKCSKVRFNVVTAADMANSSLEADSTVLYKMAVSPARDFTLGGDLLPTLGGDADTCLLKRVEAADNNKSTSVWDIVLPKSGSSFDADFYLKVSGIRYLLQARDIPAMSFGKGTQYIFNAVVRKGSVSLVLNVAAWDAVPENVSAGEGDGAGSGSWEEGGGNAGGGSGANHGIEIGRWENVDWSGGMGGNPDPVTGAVEVGSWKPAQMLVDAGGSHVADVDSWVRKTLAVQAGGNHGGGVDGWGENGFEAGMGGKVPVQVKANCGMIEPGGEANLEIEDRVSMAATATPAITLDWVAGNDYAALLIWEDVPGLIAKAEYDASAGWINVTTDASKGMGNAVVGLYPKGEVDPAAGNCIWSWHVWVTSYQPDGTKEYGLTANQKADVDGGEVHTYGEQYMRYNAGKVIMDRPLGAQMALYAFPSSAAENHTTWGVHYQWGRKDPFPKGVCVKTGSDIAPVDTYNFAGAVTGYPALTKSAVAVDIAVKNPYMFYAASTAWLSGNTNTLWGGTSVVGAKNDKTVWDPCPAGWRVPPNGTWNDFGTSYGSPCSILSEFNAKASLRGGTLYSMGEVKTWYPALGKYNSTGLLYNVGLDGNTYSCSVSSSDAFDFGLNYLKPFPNQTTNRMIGMTVRCIQE